MRITLSVSGTVLSDVKILKGHAVHQYCFDVEPFNLTACFIIKCEVKCYDYAHQNGVAMETSTQ